MGFPTGTVTLLFTDIEGSTRAWEAHPIEMDAALARHDQLVRTAIEMAEGHVFKTVGDAFCAAFGDASRAVEAAVAIQRAVAAESWPDETPIRLRMGLHSGVCQERDDDYFGPPVNRVARLEATAHGGQVVLSAATEALAKGRLPAEITLRDMGEHRLKDLGRPEQIFQVCIPGLADEFPPLRSLTSPQMPTNLPEQVSTFVGRERELAAVRAALESSRLVTLTGPGGSGKTRLAIHTGADLLDGIGDGVFVAELAPLVDPELVATTVAGVLSISCDGTRPVLDSLVDALRDRTMLLLLDNCEHVINAAATLADAILRSCPGMELLATSREPLGIDGEHVFRVPSLLLPDADEDDPEVVARSEAVALFIERGQQHNAAFTLDASNVAVVGRLVRRLDGIPLALELAAARLRSLSVDNLEQRLDQRFRILTGGSRTALPRQQTLSALIDWSYDLLTPAEKKVLARLSVFAGGWDLEAAEAIAAGGDVEDWEVLDLLTAVVDKSLVQADTNPDGKIRYRLLETVREYAAVRLDEAGHDAAEAVRTAHRDHYLGLAEQAAPFLTTHDQIVWLDRLEAERDNLRATFARCLTDADPEPGFRLTRALRHYWFNRGDSADDERVRAFLARPDAQAPDLGRGWALLTLAQMEALGRRASETLIDEVIRIGRENHDPTLTALGYRVLAGRSYRQADLAASDRQARIGLEFAITGGDAHTIAMFSGWLAGSMVEVGRRDEALEHLEAALVLCSAVGDRFLLHTLLNNIGLVHLFEGELGAARTKFTESIRLAMQLGDVEAVLTGQLNLAFAALLDNDMPSARAVLADALPRSFRRGSIGLVGYYLLVAATACTSEPRKAAMLHGAADATLGVVDEVWEAFEAALRAADQQRLRRILGDAGFDEAHAAGASLSVEEAIDMALAGG